jgi:hypothetical protein
MQNKVMPTAVELSSLEKCPVTFIIGLITSRLFAIDNEVLQGQHHINRFTV